MSPIHAPQLVQGNTYSRVPWRPSRSDSRAHDRSSSCNLATHHQGISETSPRSRLYDQPTVSLISTYRSVHSTTRPYVSILKSRSIHVVGYLRLEVLTPKSLHPSLQTSIRVTRQILHSNLMMRLLSPHFFPISVTQTMTPTYWFAHQDAMSNDGISYGREMERA